MGKSPRKWIKTVLFGKRSSKSNPTKGREKFGTDNEALANKTSQTNLGPALPVASHKIEATLSNNEAEVEVDNKKNENVLYERKISFQRNQEAETEELIPEDSLTDQEKMMLVQAATKAQAAFREGELIETSSSFSFLQFHALPNQRKAAYFILKDDNGFARRAFWALKGIIRLQALIRGRLVRRQAVATLCCMYGIVKFQALVRGRSVRCANMGLMKCAGPKPLDDKLVEPGAIDIYTQVTRMSRNTFICKLVASPPKAKPLHLQYDHAEPNSVPSWLERWSMSHFWKPVPQPKKVSDSKSQRKQSNSSTVKSQTGKSKRSIRKVPVTNFDAASAQTTSELEKPKRSVQKASSQITQIMDSAQDNPQIELEKVKRNLRKVHNPIMENVIQPELETEILKHGLEEPLVTLNHDVPKQFACDSNENINKGAASMVSNFPDVQLTPEHLVRKYAFDIPPNNQGLIDSGLSVDSMTKNESLTGDQAIDVANYFTDSSSKHENNVIENGEGYKENNVSNDAQKSGHKASTAAKLERAESGSQNSPTLPSYMAATESAKAKLRAQGSPRFVQESSERNNITRRYSLPSANGKISSHSPRTQRPVQAGSKGGSRTDKSSKDPNGRVAQAEWKR